MDVKLPKRAIVVASEQIESGRNKGRMKTTVLMPIMRNELHNECVPMPDVRRQPKNLKKTDKVSVGNFTGCYSLKINGYNKFVFITGGK